MPKPGADTDPGASGPPAPRPRRVRALIGGVALASVAFLISLAATLPVRMVAGYWAAPVAINGYSGTVWNGQARLAGGHALSWRLDPRESLAALGPRFHATLTGPGTDLIARLTAPGGPWAREIRIEGLSGRAGWPLIEAFAPPLIVACDATAAVEDVDLAIAPGRRRGAGGFRAGPGLCARVDSDAPPVPMPAVSGRLDSTETGLRGVLSLAETPDNRLAEVEIADDGRLLLTVYPAGAALVPGMPASGETTLEYPLPDWMR